MKDFQDKILLITGGASGAGFGQAKVFSEAGCKVVIADIRQDTLDRAMAYFENAEAPAHAVKLDITDREAYAAAADEVEEVFGSPPQMVFNTAGVNRISLCSRGSEDPAPSWTGSSPLRCAFQPQRKTRTGELMELLTSL